MKFMLISCGCAECRGYSESQPLIEVVGVFDTPEEAKSASWLSDKKPTWVDHPQGGWFTVSGQGDDWILPVPDNMPTTWEQII